MIDTPDSPRSGSFLTTVPGVLTAVAAVITAVGGLYLGFHSGGSGGSGIVAPVPPAAATTTPPTAPVDTLATATTSAPPPDDDISVNDLDISNLRDIDTTALGSNVDGIIDDCANGDLDACLVVVAQLTDECAAGVGVSCDALWILSPAGSDYEYFGATCGYRLDDSYAGSCEEV